MATFSGRTKGLYVMSCQRLSAIALAAAIATAAGLAAAVQSPAHLRATRQLEPASGGPVRAQRLVRWGAAPAGQYVAWLALEAELGPATRASWDLRTGVPSRILSAGISAPGSVAIAAAAEAHARAFLARHLELLAPGASPADFELVSNHTDGSLRTVGFVQLHEGMPVLGGQLSFRFKRDRLFVIASEALPAVDASVPAAPATASDARAAALAWMLSTAPAVSMTAQAGAVDGPFVLPLVGPSRLDYAVVSRVTVDTELPLGRWHVYVDAQTAEPVAREQWLRFATGTVLYDAPERYPGAARFDYPAAFASVLVDGAPATTDGTGQVTWPGASPATADLSATGTYVDVHNAAGANATTSTSLAPGGTALWSEPDDEYVDAQLAGFIHAGIVRDYVKAIEPTIPWLDQTLVVNVNVDDQCNAFSDGFAIHFFRASGVCQNTARLADVVYHEYGHTLHYQALIQGVGAYESGLSEGLSDYLAATITDDPALAPGFFYDDTPLRSIDPFGFEHTWPDDIGESHTTGLIISGALWDLRKALRSKLGDAAGVAHTDQLMLQGLRRAVDIPSMYVEVLVADDDDGNLANGTPNICEINESFGLHGLRALAARVTDLDVQPPGLDGYRVEFSPAGLFEPCPGDASLEAELEWRLRDSPTIGGTLEMLETAAGYQASIPVQQDGVVVQYRVIATLADDARVLFPANPADRYYEFFVGHVEPLYCTGFESDPADDGWTHGAEGPGVEDEWQWGPPAAPPASGDPVSAFEGQRVFGQDLGAAGGEGRYGADSLTWAESPTVDTTGYETVRLQYRRWLTVEDGFYDIARIVSDGTVAWKNHDSQEEGASLHHLDRQWRFHDVDLSDQAADGEVAVRFDIRSDGGLHFGGWTLDELCVVGFVPTVCGDGRLTGSEQCDDGPNNSDWRPDACRSDCRPARCGDGVTDSSEECDDGNDLVDDGCSPDCRESESEPPDGGAPGPPVEPIVVEQCGCRLGARPKRSSALGWAGVLGLVLLRSRRRGRWR